MIARAWLKPIDIRHFVACGALAAALAVAAAARAQDATKTFVMHHPAKPLASISFVDEQGKARGLYDFRGKVLVLNIWATWCVPCRTEMPTLDRLQAQLGGIDFEVVPVSIDRRGMEAVRKFFAEIGVKHLTNYVDTSGQILRDVGAIGLPTTLIVDRDGNEAGRVVGPAEWDAPEVVTLLRSITTNPSAPDERAASTVGKQPSLLSRSFRWLKSWFHEQEN